MMINTQLRPLLRTLGTFQRILILIPLGVAVAACISFLIYPSPYSPLIVGGIVPAGILLVALLRKPLWALYAAVFIVLLPFGLIPPHIHSLLNRLVTVLAMVTWLFGVLTGQRRIVWTTSTLLMLGFVIWSSVTLFWAGNLIAGKSVLMAYVLRFGLFLLLLPSEIRSQKALNGLMGTLALNGWVLAAVCVETIAIAGYTPGTRLKLLDMNENEMGILALMAMVGILWQTLQPSKKQRFKIRMAQMYLLITIGLVMASGSRGSAISLVIALLAFLFWKPTRRWGKLGIIVLLLGAIIAPMVFTTILDRFSPGKTDDIFGWQDTALGSREELWQAGWRLINEHPLRGVGIGNSPFEVMPFLEGSERFWGRDEMDMDQPALDSVEIHNPILVIWSETGLIGIILYVGVLVSAFWSFVRQYRLKRRLSVEESIPYFALVGSVFLGYMASWIKGGGMQFDFTYFLMLAFLLIPSQLGKETHPDRISLESR